MFAEECAVIAETEIRTKCPTKRPNSKFSELNSKDVSHTQKRRIYLSERRKMRTKANFINPRKKISVSAGPKNAVKSRHNFDAGVMADGRNLRGGKQSECSKETSGARALAEQSLGPLQIKCRDNQRNEQEKGRCPKVKISITGTHTPFIRMYLSSSGRSKDVSRGGSIPSPTYFRRPSR